MNIPCMDIPRPFSLLTNYLCAPDKFAHGDNDQIFMTMLPMAAITITASSVVMVTMAVVR